MTAAPAKPRTKRASVPAVNTGPAPTSSVVDALATTGTRPQLAYVLLELIDPDPHNPERRSVEIDAELAADIAENGIYSPVLLRPNPDVDGRYLLIAGHRRVTHGRHVGETLTPAMILPPRTDLEALRTLLKENIHRENLHPSEEAALVQGLLDLGVDEATLPREVHKSASWVKARRAVAQLPAPAREKLDARQATLDDAQALADFDGDADVREVLTAAFGGRGFAHELEMARREMTERREVAAVLAAFEAAGVKVVSAGEYGRAPAGVTTLDELKGKVKYSAIEEADHRTCPGHVAWVVGYYGKAKVGYGCKSASKHGHEPRHGQSSGPAGPMTDEQKAERRTLVANNKAALAAEKVRRDWIRQLLQRTKMPADAAVYVARVSNVVLTSYYDDQPLALEWLGAGGRTAADAQLQAPARAMAYLVALTAARVERSMPKDYWRRSDQSHGIHLAQLAEWGYELADVEREYIAKATPKAGPR